MGEAVLPPVFGPEFVCGPVPAGPQTVEPVSASG